jgi:hypothetical protein
LCQFAAPSIITESYIKKGLTTLHEDRAQASRHSVIFLDPIHVHVHHFMLPHVHHIVMVRKLTRSIVYSDLRVFYTSMSVGDALSDLGTLFHDKDLLSISQIHVTTYIFMLHSVHSSRRTTCRWIPADRITHHFRNKTVPKTNSISTRRFWWLIQPLTATAHHFLGPCSQRVRRFTPLHYHYLSSYVRD